MKRYLMVLTIAALMTQAVTSGEEPVALWVTPKVAPCHGNARLTILVARDAKNRQLKWEVDGPGYFRSSSIDLDGAGAPRSHSFLVRDLPAGEYEVRAIVVRSDSTTAVSRTDLKVVGGPE